MPERNTSFWLAAGAGSFVFVCLLAAPCVAQTNKEQTETEKREDATKRRQEADELRQQGVWAFLGLACVVLAALLMALSPIMIATLRGHPDTASIAVVSLLLGCWCFPIWVVCLAWSLKGFRRDDD